MKKVYIILSLVILVSCKKSEIIGPNVSKKVYIRIESVQEDGTSTYSPIIMTNIK